MNTRRALALLLLVFVSLSGCGTRATTSLPANVNNVYLPPFENDTGEPGLENLLTDESIQQLLAEGQLNLVDRPRQADVEVQGTVTNYRRMPLIYNDQDVVQLYKVRLEIRLLLVEPGSEEVLKKFDNIFRETRYSDVNPPVETELDAQQRVVRLLARDVVTSLVEGWPYLEL